ncbi:MAG: hypothetical protein Q9160_003234 [Pyrenula sp. 1 TL-2023]
MDDAPSNNKDIDYSSWEHSALVSRVHDLEKQLRSRTNAYQPSPSPASPTPNSPVAAAAADSLKKKPSKPFDPARHSTRYIALKFAYLGRKYNGFEHTNGNRTPLPTVEEVLWKALRKARLIWPPSGESLEVEYHQGRRMKRAVEVSWEGCQYSKCGRTDRGVSAFGQVVGVRVRSNRPKGPSVEASQEPLTGTGDDATQNQTSVTSNEEVADTGYEVDFHDTQDELPYIAMLNGLLPSDIRVLAWCPDPPPEFDARFSCQERRYKYFFTNPAFAPLPGAIGLTDGQGLQASLREGWLDIEAMREGARRLVGLHDFRNFCKIDPSKQLTNFLRRITHADIELIDQQAGPTSFSTWPRQANATSKSLSDKTQQDPNGLHGGPQAFSFTIHGSAFLWHQVRCIAAVLFLIGQGLENPSLVSELLDIESNSCRPTYEMADDSPLVLWDCIFPESGSSVIEDNLDWIYAGDARSIGRVNNKNDTKFGLGGNAENIWELWRIRKIDEVLCSTLLDLSISQGDGTSWVRGGFVKQQAINGRSQKIFEGRDSARFIGKYVPVVQRERLGSVEALNAKWREGKGARRQLRQGKAATDIEE